ncbi:MULTISPECIES: homoserine O-acetyltransferase [Gammaproteobacteria]|uniref:E22 family MetX-like putative esterase n=1 Tax=Gammaproteobacteria TaxID=1236 RepID=UPI000DCF7D32|nr:MULTISPECIES: homoserine O-acetyltransferase [Gammaproteobacteria]RTE85943.1 homoserine O-acetyltransferase [Aliidiomarina sp. B3213]TCZ90058.1 homoserine O-acetyltransferase [Lysobacter sp. N42]
MKHFIQTAAFSLAVLVLGACGAESQAYPIVEKQEFVTENFTTLGGEVIPEVRVGWEAYGELNEAKDNVILITHFFSGTSHAAGRYAESDAAPGYWDAIIGPGKAIDTDKYYVISSDTLVNQSPYDPNVITTGPSSINPETNEPYGLDFPVVTIRDFVEVQNLLLESLGIEKLHAVVGASMGSLQALEWSIAYPEKVERMASVIGMGESDPWTIAALQQWANPIMLDPNWNGGDYYGGEKPTEGVVQALMQITLQAQHPQIFNQIHAQSSASEPAPLQDISANFQAVNTLRAMATQRATYADANHILYLVRANQLFMAGHGESLEEGLAKIQAKTLFLPAQNDLLLQPYLAQRVYNILQEQGNNTQYEEIVGPWGHLDGVITISQKAELLEEFLQ